MFGYATDETEECMPLTVVLAHRLNARIAELRRSGEFWWARPDSKTQVSSTAAIVSDGNTQNDVHKRLFATLDFMNDANLSVLIISSQLLVWSLLRNRT